MGAGAPRIGRRTGRRSALRRQAWPLGSLDALQQAIVSGWLTGVAARFARRPLRASRRGWQPPTREAGVLAVSPAVHALLATGCVAAGGARRRPARRRAVALSGRICASEGAFVLTKAPVHSGCGASDWFAGLPSSEALAAVRTRVRPGADGGPVDRLCVGLRAGTGRFPNAPRSARAASASAMDSV